MQKSRAILGKPLFGAPPLMRSLTLALIPASLAAAALLLAPASAQSTTRVNVDSAGAQANRNSLGASISAGGRFVAFESEATNLVAGDTNGVRDVFVHDRQTGQTIRVSVDSAGVQGDGDSRWPSMSADGRSVAFDSEATNLVPGDVQGVRDVFVHDLSTGTTTRVSVNTTGAAGNSESRLPSISGTGRYVAFESRATNLVQGDSLGHRDVFVHDRATGKTGRVSVNSLGQEANDPSSLPSISADGRFIAFSSAAGNLVAGDTNGSDDVFVHDQNTRQTGRVSVDSAGAQANGPSTEGCVSADGRYVAFESAATNLVAGDTNAVSDVFLYDRQSALTSRISLGAAGAQAGGASFFPSLSADGSFVAFHSLADDLVAGDLNGAADVFVRDVQNGTTLRVSVSSLATEGGGPSEFASLSADGGNVAFLSAAENLVPGDRNGDDDIFVYERAGTGPRLAKSGSCPGQVAFIITNVTPNERVAVVSGLAGTFVKSGNPCQGLVLGIAMPVLQAMPRADANGAAVLPLNASAGLCGLSFQAVDVADCKATNVIVL